jgi:hypothetical protein
MKNDRELRMILLEILDNVRISVSEPFVDTNLASAPQLPPLGYQSGPPATPGYGAPSPALEGMPK